LVNIGSCGVLQPKSVRNEENSEGVWACTHTCTRAHGHTHYYSLRIKYLEGISQLEEVPAQQKLDNTVINNLIK